MVDEPRPPQVLLHREMPSTDDDAQLTLPPTPGLEIPLPLSPRYQVASWVSPLPTQHPPLMPVKASKEEKGHFCLLQECALKGRVVARRVKHAHYRVCSNLSPPAGGSFASSKVVLQVSPPTHLPTFLKIILATRSSRIVM